MSARRTRLAAPARYEAPVIAHPARQLSSAALEREQLKDAARREGRREGLAAARAEIDAAVAAQHAAALRLTRAAAALEAATADLLRRDAVTLREMEDQVVELAVQLGEELVGAELRGCDEPVRGALARAMSLIPDRGDLVVRVHPEDASPAGDALASMAGAAGRSTAIVADPGVEPGGCIVDVGSCRVDAQIGPALQRLRVVLTT